MPKAMSYPCVEFCAGDGGQALGLEQAGFRHTAAVEIKPQFCTTLRRNLMPTTRLVLALSGASGGGLKRTLPNAAHEDNRRR